MARADELREVSEAAAKRNKLQGTIIRSTAVFVALVAIVVFLLMGNTARSPSDRAQSSPKIHESNNKQSSSAIGSDDSDKYSVHQHGSASSVKKDGQTKTPARSGGAPAKSPGRPSMHEQQMKVEVQRSQEALLQALDDHLNGTKPTRESIHSMVNGLMTLFDVLNAKEPDEPARLEKGMNWLREIYGADTDREKLGTFVNNLGVYISYVKRDDSDIKSKSLYPYESLELLREALEIRILHFGENGHPHVGETLANVAAIMYGEDIDKEYGMYLGKQSYEVYRRTLGEDHPRTKNAKEDWVDTPTESS